MFVPTETFDAVVEIVSIASRAVDSTGFARAALPPVAALTRSDVAAYFEYDVASRSIGTVANTAPEPPAAESLDVLANAAHTDPWLVHLLTSGDRQARRWSSYTGSEQRRRNAMVQAIYEPLGARHAVHGAVSGLTGPLRCVLVGREDGDYTVQDESTVELIRRSLAIALRRVAAGLPPPAPGATVSAWRRIDDVWLMDPARYARLPGVVGDGVILTHRQLEVLRLAGDGLTDAAIGRRLGISARTVAKHLGLVYELVNVRNRAEAVRWLALSGPGAVPGATAAPAP